MFKRPCLLAALLTFCCLTLKGQTFTDKLEGYQALVKTYGPVACQKDNPADTEALRNARAKATKAAMEVLKASEQQLKSMIDAHLKKLQSMGLTESERSQLSQFYQGQEDQFANPCAAKPSPATNQVVSAAAQTTVTPASQAAKSDICDHQAQLPCIDQPLEGSTTIAGKALPGATVKVLLNDQAAGQPQKVPKKGRFNIDIGTKLGLNKYNQVKVVQAKGHKETAAGPVSVKASPVTSPPSDTGASGVYMLGMGGLDITSTTTSGPQQQFFTEFDLTAPISIKPNSWGKKKRKDKEKEIDPLGRHLWVWFNPRIASVPTPKTAVLSSLATSNTGLPAFGNMTLGDISQSLEFRGGLAFPLITPRSGLLFASDRKSSMSMSLLIGLGAVTPFSSATGAQEFDLSPSTAACTGNSLTGQTCGNVSNAWKQFENNEALQNQYPQLYNTLKNDCAQSSNSDVKLANCPDLHTAFVLPDRSRFLRSYYGGIRLRTFFFKDRDSSHVCTAKILGSKESLNYCVPRNVFPGTFDLTFGQDETVTGGRLAGTVMTVAANYPFPHHPWLRIFGQANMRLAHNHNSEPLTLPPTMTFIPLTDPSLIIQNVQPKDQDYFRIGFGVDITKAFGALRNEAAKAPAALLTPPTGNISFESAKPQDITVTNIGVSPLKIDSVTISGANSSDFVITNSDPCKGKTLNRAQGCTMKVTFKPPKGAAKESRTAILSIKDNAPAQPQIITLTGKAP